MASGSRISNGPNLQIQVGFNSVQYDNLNLRDSVLKKGQELCTAGHIFNVTEIQKPNVPSTINGRCVRQTSINLDPYHVSIDLDFDRNITNAMCKCIAGISGQCKHVASKFFQLL